MIDSMKYNSITNTNTNMNKYNINQKIGLYKENLIKFIIEQKNKIIPIGTIDEIDFIVGILFLTETNKYCKQNKITIHGYYLAYTFTNIFNKLKKRLITEYEFEINDIIHFITSLSKNMEYLCSRVDSQNKTKSKILNNYAKFSSDIIKLLEEIISFKNYHDGEEKLMDVGDKKDIDKNFINDKKKYCNANCANCWIFVLTKFFYLLLQTAKFMGSGLYNEPNLLRISEYYANIFFIFLKSNDIGFINNLDEKSYTDVYDNYLNYKNKLNYSLIELNLNSETLDEIIKYLDDQIVENLSIGIK